MISAGLIPPPGPPYPPTNDDVLFGDGGNDLLIGLRHGSGDFLSGGADIDLVMGDGIGPNIGGDTCVGFPNPPDFYLNCP